MPRTLCIAAAFWLILTSVASADVTYDFGYSGRLTDGSGKPYDGSVALSISFFRGATGGVPLLTVTDGLAAVPMSDGIFQVNLSLAANDYSLIFASVSDPVYVQLTDLTHAAAAPYPRQQVSMVPYAAKVPVDGKTVGFNAEGQLALAAVGSATAGQFLTEDGNGHAIWATPAAPSAVPASGGVLSDALTVSAGAGAATVDHVTITGAAAAGSPMIGTAGSDANIDLTLTPKGSGNTVISSGYVGIGTTTPAAKLEVDGAIFANPLAAGQTFLASAATAADTNLAVNATTGFPASGGLIQVDGEFIVYGGIATNSLTGLTRGVFGTSAANHNMYSIVNVVTFYSPNFYVTGVGQTAIGFGEPFTTRQTLDVNGSIAWGNNIAALNSDSTDALMTATSGHGIGLGSNGTAKRIFLDTAGHVGIGTTSPDSALTVVGAARNASTIINTTPTIDFATGNIQSTVNSCGTYALNNLKDGGVYTLVIKGTTAATCLFNAYSDAGTTLLTVHMPPDSGATTAGKHTLFTLLVASADVYVSWIPGY